MQRPSSAAGVSARGPYNRGKLRETSHDGRRQRRVCACGNCRFCADNARWDHIFREKFEDATYYSGPVVRGASSLVWFS